MEAAHRLPTGDYAYRGWVILRSEVMDSPYDAAGTVLWFPQDPSGHVDSDPFYLLRDAKAAVDAELIAVAS